MKPYFIPVLVLLSACAGSGPSGALPGAGVVGPPVAPTGQITFARVNEAILQPSCVSCHSGSEISGGVDLSSYQNVIRHVTPGNSSSSQLYTAVASGRMPQGGSPPSPELVGELRAWIDDGAPNN
jgi:hypothetical protein